MKAKEQIIQSTKAYIKEVGGNVKDGFCYSEQAASYFDQKQK